MIEVQVLSKVLDSGDYSIIEDNLLDDEYFPAFKPEFRFIAEHYEDYGNVPDKATFLGKFPEFEIVDVKETDSYLIDEIREQYLFNKTVPVIEESAKLLKDDSNTAAEYLISAMRNLQPNYDLSGVDIIGKAQERLESLKRRRDNPKDEYFTSGFKELDDLIYGIKRCEELLVIFARTNKGKSWILEKICTHIWQIGYNVGYVSPEMSAESIGYRFDTLNKHFSNSDLIRGKESVLADGYEEYIEHLGDNRDNKFIVSTPEDFDKKITISKLRNWVKKYNLHAIAIDGITYMTDERYKRGDNKTTTLTNISEDLMALSTELHIPVLIVVQANREGKVDKGSDDTPELESIRDSDGISHNASKVISLNQKENGVLVLQVSKQRFGPVGGKLIYNWDIDKGDFEYVPVYDLDEPVANTTQHDKMKSSYNDKADIF